MSIRLKLFCVLVICIYYFFLLNLIKKGNMLLRYSLMWIFAGIVFALFALCPELLTFISDAMGFNLPVNLLFTVCIGAGMLVVMGLTVIVSFQKKRLRQLSQAIALLEDRVAKNEQKIQNTGCDTK